MASRNRPFADVAPPVNADVDRQRALPFDDDRRRDQAALLRALTRAFAVLVNGGVQESALRESFLQAKTGLGAEKGVLVQVLNGATHELEILYSTGLTPENESACAALRSSPGISPSIIRRAIDRAQPELVETPETIDLDATASLRGRAHSVLCAPITDSLSGGVMAVLYFQNDAKHPFQAGDLEWIAAYAAALGQALTLYLSGQRRIHELETGWKQAQEGGPDIIGSSEATRRLVELLNVLLPSTTRADAPPILVTGASGTGKELVARYLHHFSPKRNRGPFQAFNCAGLRGDLAEARLFGHLRGAFTGAVTDSPGLFRAADKGVLFLDEIGELPPEGQALLLRVLETRSIQAVGGTKETAVDVQLVLATNRRLEDEVAAGRFREDLHYRVSGLEVQLLPLRDPSRIADIRPLLAFYLGKHERSLKKKTMGLTPAAFRALVQFSWPGNVRQLNNVCLSLVTHAAPGAWIDVGDIHRLRPEVLMGPKNPNPEAYLEDEHVTYGDAIRAFRKKLILERLQRCGGSASEAAASLGISEPTFYRYWSEAKILP